MEKQTHHNGEGFMLQHRRWSVHDQGYKIPSGTLIKLQPSSLQTSLPFSHFNIVSLGADLASAEWVMRSHDPRG